MDVDNVLMDRLVLFADLARAARSTRARTRAIKNLCDVSRQIIMPKFDADRLRNALTKACIEKPDFGDPVVFESNKNGTVHLHLNGTFDLEMLNDTYFAREREMIDADRSQ